jgi:hypothetical protein
LKIGTKSIKDVAITLATLEAYCFEVLDLKTATDKVYIKPLWGNHYRINIYRNNKINWSYFVVVNDDGEIIYCNPEINNH